MNPLILTEAAAETTETAQTFGEVLNSNAGIVAFSAVCVLVLGVLAWGLKVYKDKKNKSKRR